MDKPDYIKAVIDAAEHFIAQIKQGDIDVYDANVNTYRDMCETFSDNDYTFKNFMPALDVEITFTFKYNLRRAPDHNT